MSASPPLFPLEVHDLTVSFHTKAVLYGVDLQIEEGSLVGVIGPNGAGKSTLIKTIMGIIPPSGGWVKIFGQKGKKAYTRVGYVPSRIRGLGFSCLSIRCCPDGSICTCGMVEASK